MKETLGKRIMQHRKDRKLTQEQLAEQLGVTAQAVSKWENDQSCPDISLLPKLSTIFGITTDQLLGYTPEQKIQEAEVVVDDDDSSSENHSFGNFQFNYNSGRTGALFFGIFVCAVGIQLFIAKLWSIDISFWSILWPSALILFGVSGLVSDFSFLRLGSFLFGSYFLLDNWNILPFQLGGEFVFPALIVLFGISLLADAVKKPRKPSFKISHSGDSSKKKHNYCVNGEYFDYHASFSSETQYICIPRLSGGQINTSFGEYSIDFSGVDALAESCVIDINCSFGELTLLVPARYTVTTNNATAFAAVDVSGYPDPDSNSVITLNVHASFGEISIQYI